VSTYTELPELTYHPDAPSVALYLSDRITKVDQSGRALAIKLEGGKLELHDNWDWQPALVWDSQERVWRLASGTPQGKVQIARFSDGLPEDRLLVEVHDLDRVIHATELEGPLWVSSTLGSDTLYLRQRVGVDEKGKPQYGNIAFVDRASRSWRPSNEWPGENDWSGTLVFQAPLVPASSRFAAPVRDRVSPLAERHVATLAG
jgi:hypothetical protein